MFETTKQFFKVGYLITLLISDDCPWKTSNYDEKRRSFRLHHPGFTVTWGTTGAINP